MVALEPVRQSNECISDTFPEGLVAVFVGATSGIGEYSLLEFARCAPPNSRVYFIGRNTAAGARIKSRCEALAPSCAFEFLSSDVSLLKNVDFECRQLKAKESHINLLFQSQGAIVLDTVTSEGLVIMNALATFSRNRFMVNLLPLVNAAPTLRRVVTVGAGTTEGPVDLANLEGANMSLLKRRGQQTSIITLSLAALAEKWPRVGFVHNYPGAVQSNLYRTFKGPMMTPLKYTLHFLYRFYHVPAEETGQRHIFLATSLRYPPKQVDGTQGVELMEGVGVAKGIDGDSASGCYCATQTCDEGSDKNFALLKTLLTDGTKIKVWEHIEKKFIQITGAASI